MAVEEPDPETSVASLGYEHSDVDEYRTLAAALRARVDGDVAVDEYAQAPYATDGSIYGARPAGVVCSRDVSDVQAAVRTATDHGVPVLPRGAGSSLAGQAVGPGCVVLDMTRHMDDVLDVDPDASPGDSVVAPGGSCRTQLGDREDGERPAHPIEKLAEVAA